MERKGLGPVSVTRELPAGLDKLAARIVDEGVK